MHAPLGSYVHIEGMPESGGSCSSIEQHLTLAYRTSTGKVRPLMLRMLQSKK